jgi:hypothetical protein
MSESDNKELAERIRRDGETKERLDAEKSREANRDKTHDGRVKVGENTSVGGKASPGGGSVDVTKKF